MNVCVCAHVYACKRMCACIFTNVCIHIFQTIVVLLLLTFVPLIVSIICLNRFLVLNMLV